MAALDDIFLVVFVIAVASVVANVLIRRVVLASLAASLVSGCVLVVVCYIQEGVVSLVSFLCGGAYALAVAMIVGFVFYLVRKFVSGQWL